MLEKLKTTLHLNKPELLRSQAYIDGAWSDADSGETFPVTNPADGSLIADVPHMGVAETRRAIECADKAWPDWQAPRPIPSPCGRCCSVPLPAT